MLRRLLSTSSKTAMPMVRVATTVDKTKIADDFEVKLTDILAESMGKPRERIMIEIDAGRRIIHGATPGPVCHIVIKSIGCVGEQLNIQHTKRVTDFINRLWGIPKDKIILEFYDLAPHQVGFNGTTVADAVAKREGK
ncbi:mif-2 [Pristionchus pacificus]|uniref:Mif-2 n=1 Tax=Pristionchus pacificus TaxID=54126 RepID=A0A2A6CG61_PRIPA|nr:mif-2 [Pristionchus pacificus]|eukprot:PDM77202.1 mif-2 [Pristionchus pacificus]